MKKTVIALCTIYSYGMRRFLEEIGISFIASYLRKQGYEVVLIGFDEKSIDYRKIEELNPKVIGVPVYEVNKQAVYTFFKQVRKILPDTVLTVGGSVPTYSGKEMLEECQYIDLAVRGEGEYTFHEVVEKADDKHLWHQIEGITYRSGQGIHENQARQTRVDFKNLPFPSRDFMAKNGTKIAMLSTSRGCGAQCSFCASQLFFKKWRGREPERVVDEIEEVVNRFGIKAFDFIDSSLEDPNPDRMHRIAQGIVDRNLNIFYYAHIRAEFHKKATHEIMTALKQSGLCTVCIGVESGNEADLKLYNKIANTGDMEKAIELFRKYDINIEPGYINFNPYSTFEGLHQNIDFLEKYGFASNTEYIITQCKVYRGTKLYEKVKSDGLFTAPKFDTIGYRFIDERIKTLHEYVFNYIMRFDNRIFKACSVLNYYNTRQKSSIVCYKQQFDNSTHREAYRYVVDYEKEHQATADILNSTIASWFRKLLDLAENGWNDEKADTISTKMLSLNYLNKTVSLFNRGKKALKNNLLSLDPLYEQYLLDYLING